MTPEQVPRPDLARTRLRAHRPHPRRAGRRVVVLSVVTWAVALLVWRVGRIEEKWTTGPHAQKR